MQCFDAAGSYAVRTLRLRPRQPQPLSPPSPPPTRMEQTQMMRQVESQLASVQVTGTDVNEKDNNSFTSLHYVFYKGNLIFELSFLFKTKTIKYFAPFLKRLR